MKHETKYRMIDTRTLIIVIILFKSDNFKTSICNSPSTHDNKNWHQLSSHCRISDEWRYLVHRCEVVPHPLDLF